MTMEKSEVYSKVSLIVSQQLNVSKDSINSDSNLESLGVDSLDRVEIIMKFEEEFGVEINDEDAEKISTVGQAVDYIFDLLSKS